MNYQKTYLNICLKLQPFYDTCHHSLMEGFKKKLWICDPDHSWRRGGADMENVPSKPSAARVIFFDWGKFLVWTYASFVAYGENIILGWVTFLGYVTLPSQGNFIQTDIVYPAWVWLPGKCCKHCICT